MSGLFGRIRRAARAPAVWLGRKAATTVATAAIRDGMRRISRHRKRKRGLPPSGYRPKGRNRGSKHSFPSKKAKGKGRRARPLSASMKKQILSVVAKKVPHGVYRKHWVGTMTSVLSGQQVWQENCYYGSPGSRSVVGSDFLFFNESRLKDAASVLFNNKTKGMNYPDATNNFATPGFKYNLKSASVKALFRNNTQCPIEFVFVECVSKRYTNSFAADEFSDALTNIAQTGGTAVTKATIGVYPNQLSQMKQMYNMKTVKKVLNPGDFYVYTKSYKDLKLDWDKFHEGNTLKFFLKGITTELLVSMTPAVGVSTDSGGGSATTISGRVCNPTAQYGVSVDVTEEYTVEAPDTTDDQYRENNYCWYYNDTGSDMTVGATISSTYTNPTTSLYNVSV